MSVIKKTQDEHDAKTKRKLVNQFSVGDMISVTLIQRECECGYYSAHRVLSELEASGTVRDGRLVAEV